MVTGHRRVHIWSLKSKDLIPDSFYQTICTSQLLGLEWPLAASPVQACCSQLLDTGELAIQTVGGKRSEEDISSAGTGSSLVTSSHHWISTKEDFHKMTGRGD